MTDTTAMLWFVALTVLNIVAVLEGAHKLGWL